MIVLRKRPVFIVVPAFIRLLSVDIYSKIIIYNKKPGGEVIRCCLDCREQIISTTTYHEEPNDLFNDFKKS